MFRYDRLDPLIKTSGKTKVSLCAKMGFGPTYLRDAKKQNTNIADEPLRILAKELETTPEYLRGETDDPGIKKALATEGEGEDAQLAQLIAKFNRLSPQQKSAVLAVIESYQPSQE